MVITAYDDNGIVKDEQGGEHRGLLTLRNSWGTDVGDTASFYLIYDFFEALTLEAISLITLNKNTLSSISGAFHTYFLVLLSSFSLIFRYVN
jgi:C1A family cysteine protease